METIITMFVGWIVGNVLLVALSFLLDPSSDNLERKFKSKTAQNIYEKHNSITGDWYVKGTTISGQFTGDLHTFLCRSHGYVNSLLDLIENLENDSST